MGSRPFPVLVMNLHSLPCRKTSKGVSTRVIDHEAKVASLGVVVCEWVVDDPVAFVCNGCMLAIELIDELEY